MGASQTERPRPDAGLPTSGGSQPYNTQPWTVDTLDESNGHLDPDGREVSDVLLGVTKSKEHFWKIVGQMRESGLLFQLYASSNGGTSWCGYTMSRSHKAYLNINH